MPDVDPPPTAAEAPNGFPMSTTESPRPPNQEVQASMTRLPSSSLSGIPPPL